MADDDDDRFWNALGLEEGDVAVYQRLLEEGDGADVAHATIGLSPARRRRALDRLTALGLIERSRGGVRVRRPGAALAPAVFARQAALSRGDAIAEDLDRMWAATEAYAQAAPAFEVLRDAERIRQRLRDLISSAMTTVRVVDTPPYVSGPDPVLHDLETAAARRNVRFRTLVGFDALGDEAHARDVLRSVEEGQEVRVSGRLRTKLFIFDGDHAVLPLAIGHPGGPHVAVIAQPAIVQALSDSFDIVFDTATPFESIADGAAADGDPDERRLVQLLAAGMTDQAIARVLGLSERTLRRRVARLQEQYGAQGRFQLGQLIERARTQADLAAPPPTAP